MTRPDADLPDRETLEQLVALDVYGELEPEERERLAAALAASPELRSYADSMRATLGRLANDASSARRHAATAADTLDDDDDAWTREVRRAIESSDARRPRRIPASLVAGALGFAAGLALMAAVQASDPAHESNPDAREAAPQRGTAQAIASVDAPREGAPPPTDGAFERPTVPPRARLGSLARLGVYATR